jgi:Flp pilus assembly protein TadG
LVLATPALLLLVMLVVQFALYQHAAHLVTAAAQQAVQAAQVEEGSARDGRRAAASFLAQTSRGVVASPTVLVTRGRTTTEARVSGRTLSVVPGFRIPVRATAVGPTERFVAAGDR